jgi:RNA polymerase sigma-70 factor (ECF subfamily)
VSERRGSGRPSEGPPATNGAAAAGDFAAHREALLGVAYRMLGQMADAEDVVQEAWLRWARAAPAEVQDARAFLVRVTTRLALDRLRRLKARREAYVGPWLPEPLLAGSREPGGGDPEADAERAESVSLALLVVLETLSPLERAVFVLREAFGLSHAEVATALGRSEAAVRQLARRARDHVQARRPRFDADPDTRRRVTERFLAASAGGDLPALLAVLAPDVTLVADGGGRARAPLRPLRGAESVARFLLAVATPALTDTFLRSVGVDPAAERDVRIDRVNGGPGIVIAVGDRPVTVLVLDVVDGAVQRIYLVANPDKLASGARPGVAPPSGEKEVPAGAPPASERTASRGEGPALPADRRRS